MLHSPHCTPAAVHLSTPYGPIGGSICYFCYNRNLPYIQWPNITIIYLAHSFAVCQFRLCSAGLTHASVVSWQWCSHLTCSAGGLSNEDNQTMSPSSTIRLDCSSFDDGCRVLMSSKREWVPSKTLLSPYLGCISYYPIGQNKPQAGSDSMIKERA